MVRILVVTHRSILGEALETFIAREMDTEILRMEPGNGDTAGAILHIRPDVLIIEDNLLDEVLSGDGKRLTEHERLLVINIHFEKETMRICENRNVPVSSMADIVDVIKQFND